MTRRLDIAVMREAVLWLIQEVRDLLDASNVGLYEFIWLLRGHYPDLPMEDYRQVAREALRQLILDDAGTLVLLTWPDQESKGYADLQSQPDEYWEDPKQDVPYVAFTRN